MTTVTFSRLRVDLFLVLAIALALLSVSIECVGPEMVQYSNLCTEADPGPCQKPALKGGFPVAFLFDAPGISVERQLAFFEDRLDAGALVLDIAIYFLVCLAAPAVLRRRAARRA